MAHLIIQRGNRRETTFFRHEDCGVSIDSTAQWSGKLHVDVRAYRLMQTRAHLVALPDLQLDTPGFGKHLS